MCKLCIGYAYLKYIISEYMYIYIYIYTYWLVVSTPLKNMKVSWGYYSQLNGKMFQTTNQLSSLFNIGYTHSSW